MKKTRLSGMRLMLVLTVFAFVCMLGGCRRVEPELRAYPLAMGFDWSKESGYTVYYAMPDLAAYTGEGKAGEKRELLWTYQGSTYRDIEENLIKTREQQADLGHVQTIILGKDLLNNARAYQDTMSYLVSQPMLGSGSYVFQSAVLGQVMGENGQTVDSLGEYLVELLDKEKGPKPVILQNLFNAWYNDEPVPGLMDVRMGKERLEVEGVV